ncbi:MAG: hypothetical protein ABI780_02640 [Ardenticatenales bacterium]
MVTAFAPAKSPAHYVEKAALAAMIRQYQRNPRRRVLTDELAAALMAIAGGTWDRWHWTDSKEDFQGDCLIHFIEKKLHVVDPERNPFSWLTQAAIYFGREARKKAAKAAAQHADYANEAKHVAAYDRREVIRRFVNAGEDDKLANVIHH